MASVVLNGTTYTDDANGSTGLANGGHRTRFVPALADFVAEAATQKGLIYAARDAADVSEAAALASENAAAASALTAVNAPGTSATSTTSDTIALGSTTITIQTGKAFVVGQFVTIAYTTDATNWMHGVITAHNSGTGSITVNVSASAGGGTYSAWTVALSGPNKSLLLYSARSSNTALAVTDNNTLIDASGTYTQTFEAAATLGNGWWCYVRNAGAGVITLDPNASETIGGATTLDAAVGETYLIQCTGSAFAATLIESRKFSYDRVAHITSTGGTFTVPANVFAIRAYLFGKGGNGSGVTGGGGGSCTYGTIPATQGQVFTFTITGTVITLTSGSTYLTSNSGSGATAGAVGSVGGGLGITSSGAYAGGAGGAGSIGGAGGGSSGSPLGTGYAGGAGGTTAEQAGGGAGWGGVGGSGGNTYPGGGGGVGGAGGAGTVSNVGAGGGSGGAAVGSLAGAARSPSSPFTDPLLIPCTSPGGMSSTGSGGPGASAGPGGGGGGGYSPCGGHGGLGGGGGGGPIAGKGIFGGGNGAANATGGGGGGGGETNGSTGASAGVLIFY